MKEVLNRYFIEIAYFGQAYHGWQIQQNALSVQEKLNQALSTILREELETTGAGRTDTGVHARQLYAHFDHQNAPDKICSDRFLHSLNALLPFDISAKRILLVQPQAHARFDATQRAYEYHIHFTKDPFIYQYSCYLRDKPAIELMNKAAESLMGKQDFECFSKSHTQVFTNICDIKEAYWEEKDNSYIFHIKADRFLRNMVRAIVGTLLEIGYGKQPITYINEVIASKSRAKAGVSVPAHGLYLTEVTYPYIS